MPKLKPFYDDVQAHYDLSDDFFALFLDPTRTYSCAYFAQEDLSLEEAQLAKVDLSLGKCELSRGQTLLDIGCGWGATAIRAAEGLGANVIGLTLSKNQQAYAADQARNLSVGSGSVEFRLQGWEEFSQPVDRIISIGAFEHFRLERHVQFFEKCRSILVDHGKMLLHTIVMSSMATIRDLGVDVNEHDVAFAKFIRREIFPGGQLCFRERIEAMASEAGFDVTHVESLRMHYARTLDCWAVNLERASEQAIECTSVEVYERYMKYLSGCAEQFRKGNIDVMQFSLQRS